MNELMVIHLFLLIWFSIYYSHLKCTCISFHFCYLPKTYFLRERRFCNLQYIMGLLQKEFIACLAFKMAKKCPFEKSKGYREEIYFLLLLHRTSKSCSWLIEFNCFFFVHFHGSCTRK